MMGMYSVIIADDERLVRISMQIALSEIDIKTEVLAEASNGAEALELVRIHKPDILITDIKMPLLSGLELISQIRKENEELQIIIVSGYAEFNFAQQAIHYGVSDYLLKPISTADMKAAIYNVTRRIAKSDVPDYDNDIIHYIHKNFTDDINLVTLSEQFNFSPKYISNLIKNMTGIGFSELITKLRIEKSINLMITTDMPIKVISNAVGYTDGQYFHRVFKKSTGMTPLEYRSLLKHGDR